MKLQTMIELLDRLIINGGLSEKEQKKVEDQIQKLSVLPSNSEKPEKMFKDTCNMLQDLRNPAAKNLTKGLNDNYEIHRNGFIQDINDLRKPQKQQTPSDNTTLNGKLENLQNDCKENMKSLKEKIGQRYNTMMEGQTWASPKVLDNLINEYKANKKRFSILPRSLLRDLDCYLAIERLNDKLSDSQKNPNERYADFEKEYKKKDTQVELKVSSKNDDKVLSFVNKAADVVKEQQLPQDKVAKEAPKRFGIF